MEESEEDKEIQQRLQKILSERDHVLCDIFLRELHTFGEEVDTVQDMSEIIKKAFDENNEFVFVDMAMRVRKKILQFKQQNPFVYENLQRRSILENEKNLQLSELMYCNRINNEIHIHIAPKGELDTKTVIKSLRDGMSELVKFVSINPDIAEIVASSWIVAEHPKILLALGFTIDEDVSVDADGKSIQTARISRDNLVRDNRST